MCLPYLKCSDALPQTHLFLKKNGLRIFQKSGLFTSDYGKTVKTQWKPPKITLNN